MGRLNVSTFGNKILCICRCIAIILLLIALVPNSAGQVRASPGKVMQEYQGFAVEMGDAYAQFDEANLTWVIGNNAIEERLQFYPGGTLQQISLFDRVSGQLWSLSHNPIGVNLVSGDNPIDLSVGLSLGGTSAEPNPDGALEVRIQMNHPDSGQSLRLEQQIRSGYPVIESRVVMENHSGQDVRVVRADSISLGLAVLPQQPWEGTTITNNGVVVTDLLKQGASLTAEAPRVSGAPQDFIPLIVMREEMSGRGIFAGLRWSSNWTLSATLDSNGNPYLRGGVHLDDSFSDSLILVNGETMEGPWGFTGLFTGGLNDVSRVIDDYITASSAERPEWAALPPVTWNSWFAYEREVTEQRLEAEADLAAQMGVEVFYIDYGWSRSVGDWEPDRNRFPNGLDPLINRVHEDRMKFGLWVAFGETTPDLMVAEQHQQFLAVQPEPAARGIDGSLVYCLTPSEDWLVAELDRIVTTYQLDWIKFDQPMIAACLAPDHGHDPNIAGSLYSNNRAFYNILDRLHRAHPDLIIENCFNGNGYLDFGTRRYTSVAWLTDDSGLAGIPMPIVQQEFYGTSYAFRPDYLIQWLAVLPGAPATPGRGTSLRDLSYQAHSSMAGSFGLSLRLSEMDAFQLAFIKDLIGRYKAVRPLIAGGDFYHLVGPSNSLSGPYGGGWFVVEYYDPQKGQGAVLYVRNGEDSAESISPRLSGLNPGSTYRIWRSGDEAMARKYEGAFLLSTGLPLFSEPRQGDWIFFEQIK